MKARRQAMFRDKFGKGLIKQVVVKNEQIEEKRKEREKKLAAYYATKGKTKGSDQRNSSMMQTIS